MLQKWQQILSLWWHCCYCHYPSPQHRTSMSQMWAPSSLSLEDAHELVSKFEASNLAWLFTHCPILSRKDPHAVALFPWEPVPQKPWWEIEAGTQAKNQTPSLDKVAYLWLHWGRTEAQILISPLTNYGIVLLQLLHSRHPYLYVGDCI